MESLCGSSQKVLGDPCSSSVVFRLSCLRKHLEGRLDQIISFILSCGISWSEEASGICFSNEFPRDADARRARVKRNRDEMEGASEEQGL